MKKIALRVPVSQIVIQKNDGTFQEVNVNNLDTQWLVLNLETDKIKFVGGDKDPLAP